MKFAWSISIRTFKFVVAAVLALLLYTGCATVGGFEGEKLEAVALAALPADRTAYIYIHVPSDGGFLRRAALLLGADSRQVEGMLDNLRFVYFAMDYRALNVPGSEKPAWTCIGTGRFPVGFYATALNFDRDWNRVCGSGRHWISANADLEIALPGRQMVVAGSSGVRSVVGRLAGQDLGEEASASAAPPGAATAAGPPAAHPALVLYELLSRRPGLGFAAYLREPSALLPLDLPPRLSEGVTATVAGNFKDEIIEAELSLRFPSRAEARVAGVLIKTLVISELKKGNTGAIEFLEVTTQGDTVSLSPVLIPFQDALVFLASVTAGNGGSG